MDDLKGNKESSQLNRKRDKSTKFSVESIARKK